MSIYLSSGYVDIESILAKGYTYNFIVGGRGTGKTYGALLHSLHREKRFVYMRRTQAELDIVNQAEFNPYKKICADTGEIVTLKKISKDSSGIFKGTDEELIGYSIALSTIANKRGFDASDADLIIYDEFIPEVHVRPIKEEGAAFLNAYETVNRNRELEGDKPVQVLCLANANRADNPIFLHLGLITPAERMKEKGHEVWVDPERSVQLIILQDSPISKAKAATALYKLTAGSDYEKMALKNNFAFDDFSMIESRNLREYKPYVAIGEICVYRHKAKSEFYVTQHLSGSPDHYGVSDRELKAFQLRYWVLWDKYISGKVYFENYLTKTLFMRYNGA